ncbi:hypothetical protein BIW11_05588 [Tropilaelaps mercedesae]|uniref:Uncharacterized protein n=1 Tax=Tropilaelaps mercedesae TaxID=418985 RepID=A0A1V9Y1N9_9ACAR|nr:hypothetical protein BIW11_05588 [Tropilaelaps mercedesae]
MKYFLAIVLLAVATQAGFLGGARAHGGFPGSLGRGRKGGFGNHGVHEKERQQQGVILLVKRSPSRHGGVGRSLTVSGPTHVVQTIHHIQRVDNGGQVLTRSQASADKQNGQSKYLLLVKTNEGSRQGHGHQHQQQQQGGW